MLFSLREWVQPQINREGEEVVAKKFFATIEVPTLGALPQAVAVQSRCALGDRGAIKGL